MPESCQMVCSCAVSKLEDISRQLFSGEVSMLDLQKIRDKQQQMKRLCDATKQTNLGKNVLYEVLSNAMPLRLEEFESVKKQQSFLLHLCTRIHHEVKGTLSSIRFIGLILHAYICTCT